MKTVLKTTALLGLLALASCKKSELKTEQNESLKTKATVPTRFQSMTITAAYYVDDVNGNDTNNGTSPATAWKTITKVNSVTFAAGNVIFFKAGGSWNNIQLQPKGSGTSGSPIVISKYGSSAALPAINGGGVANGTIKLSNQHDWEIDSLEVTNYNQSEESGTTLTAWENNNLNSYANVTAPPQVTNTNSAKLAILITAQDMGQVNHIYLHALNIHGVNGTLSTGNTTKDNGGIKFEVTQGAGTQTWYNDILVDYCTIHDVDQTGLVFASSYATRTATDDTGWKPSTGIIIRYNNFYRTGGAGLIVRVAQSPLMERNVFDHCVIKQTGNAAFNFNTDDAKWQYNECMYTKANTVSSGTLDNDAGGIDADYNTKRTIIQYNFIHNNDYGLLITGGDVSADFNDGTQLKYNIIEKDGTQAHPGNLKFALKVSGHATNTMIYNNTIDVGPSQTNTDLIEHYHWGFWPSNTTYYNNIIDNSGTGSTFSLGSSTGNTFDYNAFYKNTATNEPSQTHDITGDVKFKNPGSGDPTGYELLDGSVAFNAGKVISGSGNKDYFGTPVSSTAAPNVDAYNGGPVRP